MFQYKTLHDIVFTESKLFTLLFMLKNKTGSKAYACFMSGGNRVLEIFSGMVWDSNSSKARIINREILYGIIENNRFLKLTNHLLLIAKH